jgi:enoyl-CoA hydratase
MPEDTADPLAARGDTRGLRAELDGTLGRIVLDRPKALNALTLPMIVHLEQVLNGWRDQPLSAVVIESSDKRVFCAGGDIRGIRQNTLDGRHDDSELFFATEYRVNAALATYPHPIVSLIDGVCMGGGLGLSVHGSFRIVTEAATLAMPETAIGFFPDVGASYFLPRLPGAVGMYLGLTGTRLAAADALYIGLATHFCRAATLEEIPEMLRTRGARPIDEVLRGVCDIPGTDGALAKHRPEIDECFGASDVEQIRQRLHATGSEWASEQLDILDWMSPQSLALTFHLLTRGRERSLTGCLTAELRAAHYVTRSEDFIEGVRAALVDKDRTPTWSAKPAFLSVDEHGHPVWSDDLSCDDQPVDLDPWSILPVDDSPR